ncbi:MAG TPA: LysR family transcriptional regulator [Candidatus Synoicihabitans sp.]|nr:LysR family transcriptional regulator [Candidatus Synoicihabitans sp.]
MELHQLRYVVAVAEAGNFTRAAQRAYVTQPSLSQQIAKLEEELGHKLFHRLGRRAVPTEAGLVFIERARQILLEVDNATKEMKDDPSLGRTITVGAVPTLAPYLLPPLLDRVRTELPNLTINTREGFRAELVEEVVGGKLDLAFVSLPLRDHRISIETIFSEPLLLAVSTSHRLATQPDVTPGDLANETFVMMGNGSTLTRQIERFCGEYDFVPRIGYRCAQVATLKSLVSLGLGVAILPQITRHLSDRRSLIYRELSGRAPLRELAVIRHLQRYQTRGAQQFLQLAREALHSVQETRPGNTRAKN